MLKVFPDLVAHFVYNLKGEVRTFGLWSMRHLSNSWSKDAYQCLLAKSPRADPQKKAQFKWTLPEQQLRHRQLWQVSAMNEDSHGVDYIVD